MRTASYAAVVAALVLVGCGGGDGGPGTTTGRATGTASSSTSQSHVLDGERRRLEAAGYRLGPAAFEAPVIASHEIRGRRRGKWFIAAYVASFGERRKAIAHLRASRRITRESHGRLAVDGVGNDFYWIASEDEGPLPAGRAAAFRRVVAIAEQR